jgi:hypothetical protein
MTRAHRRADDPIRPRRSCAHQADFAAQGMPVMRWSSSLEQCVLIVPDCPVVLFAPEMLNGRRLDTVSSKEGSLLVKFAAIDRLAAQQCMQRVIDVDCRAAGQAKMKNFLRATQLTQNDCVHFGDRC